MFGLPLPQPLPALTFYNYLPQELPRPPEVSETVCQTEPSTPMLGPTSDPSPSPSVQYIDTGRALSVTPRVPSVLKGGGEDSGESGRSSVLLFYFFISVFH